MALVIKTIRGRRYHYLQTSKRVNGKVVTKSIYMGPVQPKQRREPGGRARMGHFIAVNFKNEHVFDMEALGRAALERERQHAAQVVASLDNLHERYGLMMGLAIPVPVEKPVRDDTTAATKSIDPSEASSVDEGDAEAKA